MDCGVVEGEGRLAAAGADKPGSKGMDDGSSGERGSARGVSQGQQVDTQGHCDMVRLRVGGGCGGLLEGGEGGKERYSEAIQGSPGGMASTTDDGQRYKGGVGG